MGNLVCFKETSEFIQNKTNKPGDDQIETSESITTMWINFQYSTFANTIYITITLEIGNEYF